jgi:TatD DNase family protein
MIIDTHAHLNFNAFEKDADEVIQQTLAENVWMINVGSQLETSKKAIELAEAFNASKPRLTVAEKYPQGVFASVGLYPLHVPGVADLIRSKLDPEEAAAQEMVKGFDIEDYRKLATSSKKVVAIGEIGLDYYWRPKSKTKLETFKNLQKQSLLSQIDLADELNLPVIFHCRVAHNDLLDILNNRNNLRGVIHSFTGTIGQMQQYLALGLYLGFNGIIFKQIAGINWQEIIKAAPLNRILVETDAPYLIPLPAVALAKEGAALRNEPVFVKEVVKEIAKIRKLSYQEIEEQTTKNARELFSI